MGTRELGSQEIVFEIYRFRSCLESGFYFINSCSEVWQFALKEKHKSIFFHFFYHLKYMLETYSVN